ncbi:hypothetical protein E3P92_00422 [Wallemia ichthyophaga]|uniref:Major facilitator superfamily (MFS) profile domain-containing protein n=2 Tax=Wallemia ichthyophaga TaxID=245174 RepID=A0A4T0LAR2_WALIC|nr:putative transporter MCH2 [Wallemia ichthyophaga EXF-994]TIA74892.1 hypothetical protein E3P91_00778 [Wallemia ichthyophaga]EOR00993.1 putative transporter MCH2 [Wallemia ichthyophaga EXF-994]TIA81657.1 hypothetical protein E3P98_01958 [Wallemia ichthyophaga]TIA94159.1 hypothetical protein E3P97_00384 [Wallemia ichthyophaga]TIB03748.1 hypothetical protein E3P95_00488 [Wallemia ichthyophaga]
MPVHMLRLQSNDSLNLSGSPRSSVDTDAGSVDNLILNKNNDNNEERSLNHIDYRFYNLDQRLDYLQGNRYREGGRGWWVLAACTTINFFYLGQVYSFGVYQSELEKRGVAPTWKLAFVSGLATGTMALLSVPGMLAIKYTSHKHVALFGSILLGVGQIASSFATNSLPTLFATQGLVVGVGLACCLISVTGLPATWFEKRRALACGINSAGGGIGGAILSLAAVHLTEKLGLSWSLRILGMVSLIFTIPASLMLKVGVEDPPRPSLLQDIKYALKSRLFLCIILAQILASWPFFAFPTILPTYARSLGLSDSQGASFSVGYNLASAAGRLGLGALADACGNINSLILSYLLAGLGALVVWPFATSIGPLAVVVALVGIGCGGVFSLQVPCIGQSIETYRIQAGIVLFELGSSPGYFLGSFVSGLLLEKLGGVAAGADAYKPGEFYIGGTCLAACVVVLLARFLGSRKILAKY